MRKLTEPTEGDTINKESEKIHTSVKEVQKQGGKRKYETVKNAKEKAKKSNEPSCYRGRDECYAS